MAAVSPDFTQRQSDENGLERAVAFACRIVARSDAKIVRSARVVGGRRLTGAELLRLHSAASEQGLRLTMDGSGMVAVRHAEQTPDGVEAGRGFRAEADEGERCP